MVYDKMSKDEKLEEAKPVGRVEIILFGVFFILQALFVIYMIINFWPIPSGVTPPAEISLFLGLLRFNISDELRMIMIVALCGAMGSYIATAMSFITYVGNREFKKSWRMWYVLRPFIGAALALVFYFVIRGGLLVTPTNASAVEDINIYGISGISGIVGMFTKEATDKLHELFKNLFKVAEPIKREDGLKKELTGEDKKGP